MSELRDLKRPMPPPGITEDDSPRFVPAPEIIAWALATFIVESSPLHNPEHEHLAGAQLAALWTNVPNSKQMRRIVGTVEMPGAARGTKWQKARGDQQIEEWFGSEPDFLITIDAVYATKANDGQWCALLEHELKHCGQMKDADGLPKFDSDGNPVFGILAHDIEQFVTVVKRYGAVASGVSELVEAANTGPLFPDALVGWSCGTCGKPG